VRALVTGGSGFIGSHVVDSLRRDGVQVRNFDARPSPHHDPAEVEQAIGDLTDADALTQAAQRCDAIVHLAAVADVADVVKEPARASDVNVGGTSAVLEAARRAEVARVVYASTIWVYNGLEGPVDEDTQPPPPAHFYTATKLAGEIYCRSYADTFGLDCTILRFGIPYGPRAREAAVVPSFVLRALAGEPLTIAGSGEQSRRFVFVEDLADGVACALATEDSSNRIYNLVGDESVTILQIAEIVRELIGDVEIVHTESRTADFRGAEVSGARAASELGWTAGTPFREGVRRYLEWLRATSANGSGAAG